MNFCGNCGARATGSAFCTNCGQPMTAAAGQQSAASAGAQAAPPGGGEPGLAPPGVASAQPQAGPGVAPSVARSANPFAAITISDYVRDGLALLLLLLSLGMAWDFEGNGTGKVYVILAALLSIVSLSLPYLRAASVLPPHLSPAQLRILRLAANVPYLVVVLVTLVLGYVGENELSGVNMGDGVGVAVALGLAGVVLAAQGRASEQGAGTGDGPLWRLVTLGLAGLAAVLGVLSAIIVLVDLGENREWTELVVLVLGVLLFVAVPLILVLGLTRGDAGWRDATVVLGLVGLMMAFWAVGASETVGESWSLRLVGPEFLFWPALGAAAAAPGLATQVRADAGARRWTNLVLRLLNAGIMIAGLAVLIFAFRMVDVEDARGSYITVLVLSLVALAAVFVGRNALAADVRAGRQVVMGVAVALVIVGIVKAAVLGAAEAVDIGAGSATIISVWIVFAIVIALALTAPKSVRAELGTFTIGQRGAAAAAGVPVSAPRQAASQPAADPASRPTAAGSPAHAPAAQAAPADPAHPQDATRIDGRQAGPEDVTVAAMSPAGPVEEPAEEPAEESAEDPAAAEEPTNVPITDEAAADRAAAKDAMADQAIADQTAGNETVIAPTAADQTAVDHRAVDQTAVDHRAVDQPAAPAAPEPEPRAGSSDVAVMASDPNTPLQTLADIAAKEPALRPAIAMNPSTYPELLDWLRQLGDPAVDDALRRRHGR